MSNDLYTSDCHHNIDVFIGVLVFITVIVFVVGIIISWNKRGPGTNDEQW